MADFRPGALARVPFPYVDKNRLSHRPAVVVAVVPDGPEGPLLWVLMVTSAENPRWPGDIDVIDNHEAVGLPAPSLIRTAKIATVAARDAEWRGDIGPDLWAAVCARLGSHAQAWVRS